MNALTFGLLLTAGTVGADPLTSAVPPSSTLSELVELPDTNKTPATLPGVSAPVPAGVSQASPAGTTQPTLCEVCTPPAVRKLFQSDREFEGFIGPITNPVLSKDPRSNTYARALFINNSFPGAHPFGGGTAQIYALQLNLALTERLSFIADKDGIAHLAPRNLPESTGILNLAAGLKYAFYRNVERQSIAAISVMYEIPSGYANVFQNHGSGAIATAITFGKEFRENWHYLQTSGYYAPLHATQGTGFFYNSFHIDRQLFGWLYPLAELNWFYYTGGGNRLPNVVGEGDGLLNLGTQGMGGKQLVTGALGLKAILHRNVQVGAAYEIPLTERHDILNQRLTVEMIFRY